MLTCVFLYKDWMHTIDYDSLYIYPAVSIENTVIQKYSQTCLSPQSLFTNEKSPDKPGLDRLRIGKIPTYITTIWPFLGLASHCIGQIKQILLYPLPLLVRSPQLHSII